MSPTAIVAYLALFTGVGIVFLFVNLLVGKLVRPNNPSVEKLEIYECGEPTIGSSFVQFDLRFYVVALLFIIFDVEVAFFFPWASVYGKTTQLMDPNLAQPHLVAVAEADVDPPVVPLENGQPAADGAPIGSLAAIETWRLNPAYETVYRKLGVPPIALPDSQLGTSRAVAEQAAAAEGAAIQETARKLALASIYDILVFFGVLMAGFAYVWRRGDLDWVRAIGTDRGKQFSRAGSSPVEPPMPVLAG